MFRSRARDRNSVADRRETRRRTAWIPATAAWFQGAGLLAWTWSARLASPEVAPATANTVLGLGLFGLGLLAFGLLASGVARQWRGSSSFVRDVVWITACVGGLGMLLGSWVDARVESGGNAAPSTEEPVSRPVDSSASFEATGHAGTHSSVHPSAHPGPYPNANPSAADRPLPASAGHGHHSVLGATFWSSWMFGLMLLFCVPACLLLCHRSWWVHGACTVGMVAGMAGGMALAVSWGGRGVFDPSLGVPEAFWPAVHHLAMLAGMVAGAGLVALTARAPRTHPLPEPSALAVGPPSEPATATTPAPSAASSPVSSAGAG